MMLPEQPQPQPQPPEGAAGTPDRPPPDDAIRALVTRLSRPHRSGGRVVERAAVVASGADSAAIIAWIVDHDGRAEGDASASAARGGLYGPRAGRVSAPQRYVLPAGALD